MLRRNENLNYKFKIRATKKDQSNKNKKNEQANEAKMISLQGNKRASLFSKNMKQKGEN